MRSPLYMYLYIILIKLNHLWRSIINKRNSFFAVEVSSLRFVVYVQVGKAGGEKWKSMSTGVRFLLPVLYLTKFRMK